MEEEKNNYNFYNHIEDIKTSLQWLETIHVEEIQNRNDSHVTPEYVNKLENQIAFLDKQILEYEVEIKNTDDELEKFQMEYKKLQAENSTNKSKIKVLEAENSLLKNIDEVVLKTAESYNKLPKLLRRIYK